MATVAYTPRDLKDGDYVALAAWTLTGTDDGSALYIPNALYTMWMALGTFGGGTITIECSIERTVSTWASVTTQTGTTLTFTAAGVRRSEGAYVWVRPLASVSVTSVVVYCMAPADHRHYIARASA